MREMAKVMFAVYVAFPTKVAVLLARSQAMIVHSVSSRCIHRSSPSLTVAKYGVNAATSSICTVS